MTRRKSTPPEAALVAIDVAKHRNEVLIDPGHGRRRRMTVLNTRADHDRFIATLRMRLRDPSSSGSNRRGTITAFWRTG